MTKNILCHQCGQRIPLKSNFVPAYAECPTCAAKTKVVQQNIVQTKKITKQLNVKIAFGIAGLIVGVALGFFIGKRSVTPPKLTNISSPSYSISSYSAETVADGLYAIYQRYGIDAADLQIAVNQIEYIAQHPLMREGARITPTNEDIVNGIATAGSANTGKMGIPLPTLAAIIGVTVGRTGYSSNDVGLALRDLAHKIRSGDALTVRVMKDFHVSPYDAGGQLKSMDQILTELFPIDKEERRLLVYQMTASARGKLEAIFEYWLDAQEVSIAALRNIGTERNMFKLPNPGRTLTRSDFVESAKWLLEQDAKNRRK